MQFQVPQFIEREIRVVGPLTFKQFVILGLGILICAILYLFLASKSFFLFLLSAVIIMGSCLILAMGKSQGRSASTLIINFFTFLISGRTYLWKKKAVTPKLFVPPKVKKKKKEKPSLTATQTKSQLENLATSLETHREGKKELEEELENR